MHQLLKSKLGDCQSVKSLCASKSSYELISDAEFYIFDPPSEENQPVRIVRDIQQQYQLKVNNPKGIEICLVKTDKCLFKDTHSKCDCILFSSENFFLVEIKNSTKKTKRKQKQKAIAQLGATLDILIDKEVPLSNLHIKAIMCFNNTPITEVSENRRKEEFRIRYKKYNVKIEEVDEVKF